MATRYPIILVHGMALKNFAFFRAFGRIEKVLRADGNTVFSSHIDGFGTTATNAVQLKAEILHILDETGADKVNIIAHSKGGLDSKRMIRELDMEACVASLTTLCTPHRGSPIATNLLRLPGWILAILNFFLNFWYRIFGDKHPNALEVCRELALTEPGVEEAVAFSKSVYCQSYSSKMNKGSDDFIMSIPLMFSRYYEKRDSDGLVPCESAIFENYKGDCVDIPVSHTEIIDFFPKKHKRDKIFIFYTELCHELAEMGF